MSDENTPVPDTDVTGESAAGAPVPAPPAPVPVPAATPVRTRRAPAIWWGVVLVLVGAALLVGQFAPGIQLWRYWPLIIIAFGVRAMFGPAGGPWSIRHLGEGLTTVTFGLVFLGQMIGYLGWDVWLNILRLWPLLLVSLGLEIAGKGLKSEWVRALGSVVVIGGLAYGALAMTSTGGWPISIMPAGETEPFEFSADRDPDVTQGYARVDGGVGSLSILAGRRLATAEGRSPFDPVFEVESGHGDADVRIGLGSHSWGPLETDTSLDVTLSEDVTWDLEVAAGVTEYDADLSGLTLSALTLDAGVSDGTLTLGPSDAGDAEGATPVTIESGVSALRIRVPEGDSVRVTVSQGLAGVTTRGDWTSEHDGDSTVYKSDRFRDTGTYWDIEIEAGIGGITVEYY